MQANVTNGMNKLPEGLNKISTLLGLSTDEVRAWEYFKEIQNSFKDYNFGVLKKEELIDKLMDISYQCADKKIFYFCTAIDKAVAQIKLCY